MTLSAAVAPPETPPRAIRNREKVAIRKDDPYGSVLPRSTRGFDSDPEIIEGNRIDAPVIRHAVTFTVPPDNESGGRIVRPDEFLSVNPAAEALAVHSRIRERPERMLAVGNEGGHADGVIAAVENTTANGARRLAGEE